MKYNDALNASDLIIIINISYNECIKLEPTYF